MKFILKNCQFIEPIHLISGLSLFTYSGLVCLILHLLSGTIIQKVGGFPNKTKISLLISYSFAIFVV